MIKGVHQSYYPPVAEGGAGSILIPVVNLGDGDTVTHTEDGILLIVTFYNADDDARRYDGFYVESGTATTTSFVLKNDFTTDKFNGILLCVKAA